MYCERCLDEDFDSEAWLDRERGLHKTWKYIV